MASLHLAMNVTSEQVRHSSYCWCHTGTNYKFVFIYAPNMPYEWMELGEIVKRSKNNG